MASDLMRRADVSEAEGALVDSFADAWDMPSLGTVGGYEAALGGAGLELEAVEDVTEHSVGRFRKWTALYLALLGSPLGALVERLLEAYGLDPAAITEQVTRAHRALPFLRHVIFVAKRR